MSKNYLDTIKVWRTSEQGSQLDEFFLLFVLFLSNCLQLHTQVFNVRSKVSNGLETVLKIAKRTKET